MVTCCLVLFALLSLWIFWFVFPGKNRIRLKTQLKDIHSLSLVGHPCNNLESIYKKGLSLGPWRAMENSEMQGWILVEGLWLAGKNSRVHFSMCHSVGHYRSPTPGWLFFPVVKKTAGRYLIKMIVSPKVNPIGLWEPNIPLLGQPQSLETGGPVA